MQNYHSIMTTKMAHSQISLYICAILCIAELAYSSAENSTLNYAPVVQLSGGKVRGLVQQVQGSNKQLLAYQGIRYG